MPDCRTTSWPQRTEGDPYRFQWATPLHISPHDYLKAAARGQASIVITDQSGQEVAKLEGPAAGGINTVVWNMRLGGGRGGGSGRGGRGGGTRGGAGLDQLSPLGDYTVTLTVGGTTLAQKARIAKSQGWSFGPTPTAIR